MGYKYNKQSDRVGSNQLAERKTTVSYLLKNIEVEDEDKERSGLTVIPQPETPNEPIEFLSRSWSLSANEVSKAIAKNRSEPTFDSNLHPISEAVIQQQQQQQQQQHQHQRQHQLPDKHIKPAHGRIRTGAIGKLFHHKEHTSNNTEKKKDKLRVENAHMHVLLSVAGLATALAATTSTKQTQGEKSCPKMDVALASATELLASYCIELAESAGVEHERVASVVHSAVGICTASDLSTLTAAAATALRGEAALKARLPKESKKSATISPYEKGAVDPHSADFLQNETEENHPCVGDLLQITQKGVLRWKNVSVYINKKHEVKIKLKSKHVGGAFSKKHKYILYEVIDESGGWPFRKERDNIEIYFGVKTSRGLLEFKCKNKIHRQKWLDGIVKLLQQRSCIEEAENSIKLLSISKSF